MFDHGGEASPATVTQPDGAQLNVAAAIRSLKVHFGSRGAMNPVEVSSHKRSPAVDGLLRRNVKIDEVIAECTGFGAQLLDYDRSRSSYPVQDPEVAAPRFSNDRPKIIGVVI